MASSLAGAAGGWALLAGYNLCNELAGKNPAIYDEPHLAPGAFTWPSTSDSSDHRDIRCHSHWRVPNSLAASGAYARTVVDVAN